MPTHYVINWVPSGLEFINFLSPPTSLFLLKPNWSLTFFHLSWVYYLIIFSNAIDAQMTFLEAVAYSLLSTTHSRRNSCTDVFNDITARLEEISHLSDNYEYIVCGDFNLTNIKWSNEPLLFELLDYVAPAMRDNANRLCQTSSFLGLHQLYLQGECTPSGKRIFAGIGESISGT